MLTIDNLIKKGYLPYELVPPFNTETLSTNMHGFLTNIENDFRKKPSKRCTYSIPKIKNFRRH